MGDSAAEFRQHGNRAKTLGFTSPFTRALRSRVARYEELRALAVDLGRLDFERRHPNATFGPVLVLVPSYLEASNIEDVLTAIPPVVHGLAVSVLVVIDGGNDGTEEIVANVGAMSASLPVNLGQGRALRLGYELASTHGARYVVTIDADGQNDSKEIPDHLAPLMTDEADVVIASRKLGVDEFSGAMRQFGVKLFARIISRLSRQRVTDSTNSFRAFKIEVLQSLTLEQDQYQTAEMILSIAAQGWRIAEVPTVRRLRASGESKKVLGAESSARSLRLFLGANSYFGLQYTRVIALTWWRERRNLRCRASEPFPRS